MASFKDTNILNSFVDLSFICDIIWQFPDGIFIGSGGKEKFLLQFKFVIFKNKQLEELSKSLYI